LLLVCWIKAPWINSRSFRLWAGLMCVSAIMCFYGAISRSKWFLCPGFAAILSVVGTFLGALIKSAPVSNQ
jgi:hypothetical protein